MGTEQHDQWWDVAGDGPVAGSPPGRPHHHGAAAGHGAGAGMADFDGAYWESHWSTGQTAARRLPVHPYLPGETARLPVGTALDVGCGTGTEALWLAQQGWRVTAADISTTAIATAASRAAAAGVDLELVETDVTRWEPGRTWDLVVTSYAHPTTGQLPFYERIAAWVAPGGAVLIVGHLHDSTTDHHRPASATATLEGLTALFAGAEWRLDAAYENTRAVDAGGRSTELRDVVVRAHRRG